MGHVEGSTKTFGSKLYASFVLDLLANSLLWLFQTDKKGAALSGSPVVHRTFCTQWIRAPECNGEKREAFVFFIFLPSVRTYSYFQLAFVGR